jgi:PPM family protein phosphatase
MLGRMDCSGLTNIGSKRDVNQDHFLIADLNKSLRVHETSLGLNYQTRLFGGSQGKLLMVADGMGGHQSGERASMLAIDGVVSYVLESLSWMSRLDDRQRDFETELIGALDAGQKLIQRESAAIPAHRGMGTTLTLAYIYWPKMYVVHAGDSRCYMLGQGKFEQLTTDHTMAALTEKGRELVDQDAQLAKPMSHVLYSALGGNGDGLYPDVGRYDLAIGDAILLCTDGLTRHVASRTIREHLSSRDSAKTTCQKLVQLAIDGGGSDNITVVVAKFRATDEELCEEIDVECFGAEEVPASKVGFKDDDTLDSPIGKNSEETRPVA